MNRKTIGNLLFAMLTATLLGALPGTVFGQIFEKGSVNIGLEGGVQFTNISDSYTLNSPTGGTGYTFGPYLEYHVSRDFKLRFALNYDHRVFELNEPPYAINDTSGNFRRSYIQIKRDYRLNYLTMPLSLIYIKGNERFKIYLQVSFYYSLYLNAHVNGFDDLYIDSLDYQNVTDTTLQIGHNIRQIDEEVESGFNSSDFGLNFYVGGIIKLSPGLALTIAPGFSWGMANVYENPSRRSRWSRLLKINAGIVYTIPKKSTGRFPDD